MKATRSRSPQRVASQTHLRWRPGAPVRAWGDRGTATLSGLPGNNRTPTAVQVGLGPSGDLGAQLWVCGVCMRVLARPVGVSGPWSVHRLHTCPMHRTCVFAPGRGRPRARLSPLGAPAVTGGRGGGAPRGEDHWGPGREAHAHLHTASSACVELEPQTAKFKESEADIQVLFNLVCPKESAGSTGDPCKHCWPRWPVFAFHAKPGGWGVRALQAPRPAGQAFRCPRQPPQRRPRRRGPLLPSVGGRRQRGPRGSPRPWVSPRPRAPQCHFPPGAVARSGGQGLREGLPPTRDHTARGREGPSSARPAGTPTGPRL